MSYKHLIPFALNNGWQNRPFDRVLVACDCHKAKKRLQDGCRCPAFRPHDEAEPLYYKPSGGWRAHHRPSDLTVMAFLRQHGAEK